MGRRCDLCSYSNDGRGSGSASSSELAPELPRLCGGGGDFLGYPGDSSSQARGERVYTGWGYKSSGEFRGGEKSGVLASGGGQWAVGDVITLELDTAAGPAHPLYTISVFRNGTIAGCARDIDLGASPTLYPMAALQGGKDALSLGGQREGFSLFRYPPTPSTAAQGGTWKASAWGAYYGWWVGGREEGPGVLALRCRGAAGLAGGQATATLQLPQGFPTEAYTRARVGVGGGSGAAPPREGAEGGIEGFLVGQWKAGAPVGAHAYYSATLASCPTDLALACLPHEVADFLRLQDARQGCLSPQNSSPPCPWPAGTSSSSSSSAPGAHAQPLLALLPAELQTAGLFARLGWYRLPPSAADLPAHLPDNALAPLSLGEERGTGGGAGGEAQAPQAPPPRDPCFPLLERRLQGEWGAAAGEPFVWCPGSGATPGIQVSPDLRSVTISSPMDGHGGSCILGSRGYSSGKHYWEVQMTSSMENGRGSPRFSPTHQDFSWFSQNFFIGVAERPGGTIGDLGVLAGVLPLSSLSSAATLAPSARAVPPAAFPPSSSPASAALRFDPSACAHLDTVHGLWNNTTLLKSFTGRSRAARIEVESGDAGSMQPPQPPTADSSGNSGSTFTLCLDMDAGTLTFAHDLDLFVVRTYLSAGVGYRLLRTGAAGEGRRTLYPCVGVIDHRSARGMSRQYTLTLKEGRSLSSPTPAYPLRVQAFLQSSLLLRDWCRWLGQGNSASASASSSYISRLVQAEASSGGARKPLTLSASILRAFWNQYEWEEGRGTLTLRSRAGTPVHLSRSNAALRAALRGTAHAQTSLRGGDVINVYMNDHYEPHYLAGVCPAGLVWYIRPNDRTEPALFNGGNAKGDLGGVAPLWNFLPKDFSALLGSVEEAVRRGTSRVGNFAAREAGSAVAREAAAEAAAGQGSAGAAAAAAPTDAEVLAWALDPWVGLPVPHPPAQPWQPKDDLLLVQLVDAACAEARRDPETLSLRHAARLPAAALGSGDAALARAARFEWATNSSLLPLQRLRARFALLLAINSCIAPIFPMVSFSLAASRSTNGDGAAAAAAAAAASAASPAPPAQTPTSQRVKGAGAGAGAQGGGLLVTSEASALFFSSLLGSQLARSRGLVFETMKTRYLDSLMAALSLTLPDTLIKYDNDGLNLDYMEVDSAVRSEYYPGEVVPEGSGGGGGGGSGRPRERDSLFFLFDRRGSASLARRLQAAELMGRTVTRGDLFSASLLGQFAEIARARGWSARRMLTTLGRKRNLSTALPFEHQLNITPKSFLVKYKEEEGADYGGLYTDFLGAAVAQEPVLPALGLLVPVKPGSARYVFPSTLSVRDELHFKPGKPAQQAAAGVAGAAAAGGGSASGSSASSSPAPAGQGALDAFTIVPAPPPGPPDAASTALQQQPPEAAILELYRLWGNITGLSIRHGVLLAVDTPASLWRPMVGLHLRLRDIAETYPDLGAALQALTECAEVEGGGGGAGALAALRQCAMEAVEALGEARAPPGAARAARVLTFSMRAPFIRYLAAAAAHNGSGAAFTSAWHKGLSAVLPTEIFPLWSPRRLSLLLTGDPELSVHSLRGMVVVQECPSDWSSAERAAFEQTLGWLWEVLEEGTDGDRLAFFSFVTGQRRVPAVPPTLTIHPNPIAIPKVVPGKPPKKPGPTLKAHTCSSTLDLNIFRSKALLQLWVKEYIQCTEGFDIP